MKGKIQALYPEGRSSVYGYFCRGEKGIFSFPVEWRYHMEILENEGTPIGRGVEYLNNIYPPSIK